MVAYFFFLVGIFFLDVAKILSSRSLLTFEGQDSGTVKPVIVIEVVRSADIKKGGRNPYSITDPRLLFCRTVSSSMRLALLPLFNALGVTRCDTQCFLASGSNVTVVRLLHTLGSVRLLCFGLLTILDLFDCFVNTIQVFLTFS